MARSRRVDQRTIDNAFFITQVADKRLVDPDRMAAATKTVDAALDEMEYFCDPANAAHIGRFAGLRYAWRMSPVFRTFMLVLGIPCAFMGVGSLLAEPWPAAIPRVLQFLGLFGICPALVGAVWLLHAWWKPEDLLAYMVRAAPLVGDRLPAHCSASGKMLLACLPDDQLRHVLTIRPLVARTPASITDPTRLRSELAVTRARGYGLAIDEMEDGTLSVAVPLRDRSGRVIAAMSLASHRMRRTPGDLAGPLLAELRSAAPRVEQVIEGFQDQGWVL